MSVLFCVRKLQSNESEQEWISEKEKTTEKKERILIMVIWSRVPFACVIWHFLPACTAAQAQRIYDLLYSVYIEWASVTDICMHAQVNN